MVSKDCLAIVQQAIAQAGLSYPVMAGGDPRVLRRIVAMGRAFLV